MKRIATAGIVAALASASMSFVNAPPANAKSCTVAAVGDIAGPGDYETGPAKTAALIRDEDPERVIALGDLAYDDGTVKQFEKYYRPTWGALRSKVEAVPGNHDLRRESEGITRELGASSVRNRGINVCGWRLILVNQYDDLGKAAAFITADAKAHRDVPKIVAWHEPRFSSGSKHGNDPSVQPLWAAATAAGARIVLNAHEHSYERFAPMDREGVKSSGGTRQFVSGLGGHNIRGMGEARANSERRYTGQPAVLFLTLNGNGSYKWSERSFDGTVRDSGRQAPSTGTTTPRSLHTTAKDLLSRIADKSTRTPGGSADKTRQIARLHELATTPVSSSDERREDLLSRIADKSTRAPGGSADKTRQIAQLHELASTPLS